MIVSVTFWLKKLTTFETNMTQMWLFQLKRKLVIINEVRSFILYQEEI